MRMTNYRVAIAVIYIKSGDLMKYGLLITTALFVFSFPVFAANSCYSPLEVQAEQLLRLHSELMVITVTCKQGSMGQDLVSSYTGFTRNNIDLLHDAEQTMIKFYKKTYGGDGVSRLDKLRTMLANEYGQQIANISAPVFCSQRRDKVLSMVKAPTAALQYEAQSMCTSNKTYLPSCGQEIKVVQKGR